jgi:hypothetical protein
MESISNHKEYIKALKEGRSVESFFSYMGRCLLPLVHYDSFLTILLKNKDLDVCYYKKSNDTWHIEQAMQGIPHHLEKVIPSKTLNNKETLNFWHQVFFKEENGEFYSYDKKYDEFKISDSSKRNFKAFIRALKKEIQDWNINTRHYPLSIVVGEWVSCAPIAYCCQKLLTTKETYCRVQLFSTDDLENSVSYSVDPEYGNLILPIGKGISINALLSSKVRVSFPLVKDVLEQELLHGVTWSQIVNPNAIDYCVGDIPYSIVQIGTGVDMEGNIWIEAEGSDSKLKRVLVYESSTISESCVNNESVAKKQYDEKEIDLALNAKEEKVRSFLNELAVKCKNKRYTTDSIFSIDVQELKELESCIESFFGFDYILTDTNCWMTSDGWDVSHNPVLKYKDMLIALSFLLKGKRGIFELEGTAYSELIKHTKNKSDELKCESSNEAKKVIDYLKENQLIVVKGIPLELTPEEQEEIRKSGGNPNDFNRNYADPRIRRRLVDRLGKYNMMVLSRDRDLRIRLHSACRDVVPTMSEKDKDKLDYPCIVNPDDCIPILHVWWKITKELARRSGEQPSIVPSKSFPGMANLFLGQIVVDRVRNQSSSVPPKKAIEKKSVALADSNRAVQVAISNSSKVSSNSQSDIFSLPKIDAVYSFLRPEELSNELNSEVIHKKLQEIENLSSKISMIVTDANIWCESCSSDSGRNIYFDYLIQLIFLLVHAKSNLFMSTEDSESLKGQFGEKAENGESFSKLIETGLLQVVPASQLEEKLSDSLKNSRYVLLLSKEDSFLQPFFHAVNAKNLDKNNSFLIHLNLENNESLIKKYFSMAVQYYSLSEIMKKNK